MCWKNTHEGHICKRSRCLNPQSPRPRAAMLCCITFHCTTLPDIHNMHIICMCTQNSWVVKVLLPVELALVGTRIILYSILYIEQVLVLCSETVCVRWVSSRYVSNPFLPARCEKIVYMLELILNKSSASGRLLFDEDSPDFYWRWSSISFKKPPEDKPRSWLDPEENHSNNNQRYVRDLGIMRMGACCFHVLIVGLGGFHLCKGFKTDSIGKRSRQGHQIARTLAVASPLQETFSRMRRRKTMEEFCESGCHLRFSHQSWAGQCETIRFRAIFNIFWSSILASLLWQHVLDPKPRNYILARCLPFSPTMPSNGQGVDHNQQRCLMALKKGAQWTNRVSDKRC